MTEGKLRVLVTNDDGIQAPALRILAEEASRRLGAVTVVAPDREQSGVSHALTIRHPLRVSQVGEGWYAVEGTPTDCVNLAFFQLMEHPPDLVLSGINAGYNLGDDVTYSGTVAGAMESRILGAPALAVSTAADAGREHFVLAARVACELALRLLKGDLPEDAFLNINVPPDPKGYRIARQGRRVDREGLVTRHDPKGRAYFWVGLAPSKWCGDPEADHAAVEQGWISVTPLHADLTSRQALTRLEAWGLERERPR